MTKDTYERATAWLDREQERRERGHEPGALDLWLERMTDALDECYTGHADDAEEICFSLDADPPPGYLDEDLVIGSGWLGGVHHDAAIESAP